MNTSNIHHYLFGAPGRIAGRRDNGNAWSGSYVSNSGSLVPDLLYKLTLVSTGRLQ